jgi:hypothetical protein
MDTTYRGREGMRQFAETAWKSFDMAVEPEEMTTAPDVVDGYEAGG